MFRYKFLVVIRYKGDCFVVYTEIGDHLSLQNRSLQRVDLRGGRGKILGIKKIRVNHLKRLYVNIGVQLLCVRLCAAVE